ncbi:MULTISPECIES: hypothetical protein [Pseudomonas]|uniref:Lipoprotein n=1 Tax=Pseudomonas putida TaxID=303 RepID=A0A1B2F4Q9_PSEPU|nr:MULTISPECIES: hypothetical protein [Pseudomonas]ANY87157.1 hypothetical protein IEC33019_1591 [Pseudomonas putida]MCL8305510.1 hypothetical protein [Pseudomonas putida]
MPIAPMLCLLGGLTLLGGCFDRDDDHPAKDADPSKPSLQMQQPDTPATAPASPSQPMPSQDPDN